ncbi:MAG: transporter ATP-binding protein [Actinomycetia bacterium]|nr:transporter ATP-binding protein [Actinomycetes bacterium]
MVSKTHAALAAVIPAPDPDPVAGDAAAPAVDRSTGRAVVRLVGATKTYGAVQAVASLDLEICDRELFTLLGPSGSGKTTVLRMIAGLVAPTSGEIWIGDEEVHARPTYQRDIAMVFQSLALFPHLTVFGNIAFPLKMRRTSKAKIQQAVTRALQIVRLPGIEGRMVHELSGGQRQRVAIARALVYEPKLLLLDEPLGALDRRLREEMQLEIVRLHNELDVTIVNVTHDQREALMLSDRIGVMRDGRLEQVGPPTEIYRQPGNGFVAEFVGNSTILEGTLQVEAGEPVLVRDDGRSVALEEADDSLIGRRVLVILRAEAIRIVPADDAWTAHNADAQHGVVRLGAFEGDRFYYEIQCPDLGVVKVSVGVERRQTPLRPGDPVVVSWDRADLLVMEA